MTTADPPDETAPPDGAAREERRSEDRSEVKIPIFYHLADGIEERVSATLDLSLSGLSFQSSRKVTQEDRLRMRLLLPGELRPRILAGSVRWCRRIDLPPARYSVGVRFAPEETKQQQRLREVLGRGADAARQEASDVPSKPPDSGKMC